MKNSNYRPAARIFTYVRNWAEPAARGAGPVWYGARESFRLKVEWFDAQCARSRDGVVNDTRQ